jgi:uncharacterized membrane protein
VQSSRLEAFSDGVLAIIITVMVLELRLPEDDHTLHAFVHTTGLSLLTYLLSFVYIGLYWNNHHHLFQVAGKVDGMVLWANLHLLFWLSLLPLTNNWMDESHLEQVPTAFYGVNLLGAAVAYFVLEKTLQRLPGHEHLAEIFGNDLKGKISPVLYLVGIGLAFVEPWLGVVPYAGVALMWLVPDRRVERWLAEKGAEGAQ